MEGSVLSIERCSVHDGPGLRTTVFLKGCPLSCLWCHNPESQALAHVLFFFDEKCTYCGLCAKVCANHVINEAAHVIGREKCRACGRCAEICPVSALEIKGKTMETQDVIDIVLKDKKYYERSGGGLTLSGGEPFLQFEFMMDILKKARENGLHTCIETSGYAPAEHIKTALPYVDIFLYDFKESNDVLFKQYMSGSLSLVLKNLFAIDSASGKIILRCPVIPAINNREDHFTAIAETANRLKNIIEINIMPYHPLGASKAKRIGGAYALNAIDFPTEDEKMSWVKQVADKTDVPVKCG